ncbi:MAG: hypothetical protein INQ03_20675 [Candidatus Heimdallarchaeota archaeon]|nr:hypothetical protein [Candidatus Heimdallarchaeota archaeon]
MNAPVRLKFIGSRASGDARKEFGYHYKTEVLDQGDEDSSFKARILGDAEASTDDGVSSGVEDESDHPEHVSYAEMAAKQGISVDDLELDEKKPEGKFGKMGGIGSRPQASFLASGLMDDSAPAPPTSKMSKKDMAQVFQKDSKASAKKILEELGEPAGYSREMVVVGNGVYRIGGTSNNLDFKELDNPLDGIILVKEYTPRIIAEGGIIKVIELLRRTSEEETDDEVMTQDLADLTSMFQIEIG